MRGDVGRMSWAECVEWGRRAAAWCDAHGEKTGAIGFAHGLKALDAPFKSTTAPCSHHSKSFAEYRQECLGGPAVAENATARTVTLGAGVTANAPYRLAPAMLLSELQDRYDRHSEQQAQEVYRTVTINLSAPGEPVAIIHMGDMHIGSPQTNPRDLIAVAQACESKTAKIFAGSVGDVLDAPIKQKLIEEAWKSAISPEEEIAAAVMILDRIAVAGRLLYVNAGNHDLFSQKIAGYSHLDVAMSRLSREIPYARYEMILTVNLAYRAKVVQSYKLEIRHKFRGGGQYPAAAGIRHMRTNHRDVDATIAGHTHSTGQAEMELFEKRRHVIQLGSYKGRGAYDTEHGYTHNNLYPDRTMILWPDRHKLEVLETERGIRTVEDWHGSRRRQGSPVVRVPVAAARRGRKRRRAG